MTTKISELAASIASAEAEIKDATAMRAKEAEEFAKVEGELILGVEELDGALKSIHMMSNPALLQQSTVTSDVKRALNSLSSILDAASLSGHDRAALTALVQNGESNEDDLSAAPAGATYESHGAGIEEL